MIVTLGAAWMLSVCVGKADFGGLGDIFVLRPSLKSGVVKCGGPPPATQHLPKDRKPTTVWGAGLNFGATPNGAQLLLVPSSEVTYGGDWLCVSLAPSLLCPPVPEVLVLRTVCGYENNLGKDLKNVGFDK